MKEKMLELEQQVLKLAKMSKELKDIIKAIPSEELEKMIKDDPELMEIENRLEETLSNMINY